MSLVGQVLFDGGEDVFDVEQTQALVPGHLDPGVFAEENLGAVGHAGHVFGQLFGGRFVACDFDDLTEQSFVVGFFRAGWQIQAGLGAVIVFDDLDQDAKAQGQDQPVEARFRFHDVQTYSWLAGGRSIRWYGAQVRVIATALIYAVCGVACGGAAGPPRGPAHDPVNSPEAESPCPAEWAKAKEAREQLIELAGPAHEQGKLSVFRAVLAQADCEAGVFERWSIEVGPMQIMTAELKAMRRQFQNAFNLYQEVAKSADGRFRVLALARTARLQMTFADKLAQLPVPHGIEPGERKSWRLQQLELSQYFAAEAQMSASSALEAAPPPGDDSELAAAINTSCQLVSRASGARDYPLCSPGTAP